MYPAAARGVTLAPSVFSRPFAPLTGLFAGVVLTAGRSRRMGSPKALLTFEGGTFLERVLSAYRGGGCDRVVVVTGPESDADAAQIATLARGLGADVAINPDRDSQQVESVRAALGALRDEPLEGVLVSPVDAPGVTPELVKELIDAGRTGAPIAVPEANGRRGHPVLFAGPALEDLEGSELAEGARTVLRKYERQIVHIPATAAALLDIDTPEEYERLRKGDK